VADPHRKYKAVRAAILNRLDPLTTVERDYAFAEAAHFDGVEDETTRMPTTSFACPSHLYEATAQDRGNIVAVTLVDSYVVMLA
jgi:hypothetical protein